MTEKVRDNERVRRTSLITNTLLLHVSECKLYLLIPHFFYSKEWR